MLNRTVNWDIFNPTEEEILSRKKAGIIYMADFPNNEGKYISAIFDDDQEPYDLSFKISSRIEVRITYITHDEKITGVQISKLYNGKIEKLNMSTLGFEGILSLLHIFSNLDIKSITNKSIVLDSGIIDDEIALRTHLNTILADERGLKIISELATEKGLVVEGDIGNIARKKEAVELFDQLLNKPEIFDQKKKEWEKSKDEDVWQKFFEDNKWIFGYGLEYVFNAPINKDKLQQTLYGSNFLQHGKRPDGILKTLGLAQFINIVEIKTSNKSLLDNEMYRKSNVWQVSNELVGSVSQCQQYIRISKNTLDEFFEIKDKEGNRTDEEIFCFNPKCFLIIGNLEKEFSDGNGKIDNPDKLSCFEYFRNNLLTPEIITFDQLYHRAKNIIDSNL